MSDSEIFVENYLGAAKILALENYLVAAKKYLSYKKKDLDYAHLKVVQALRRVMDASPENAKKAHIHLDNCVKNENDCFWCVESAVKRVEYAHKKMLIFVKRTTGVHIKTVVEALYVSDWNIKEAIKWIEQIELEKLHFTNPHIIHQTKGGNFIWLHRSY